MSHEKILALMAGHDAQHPMAFDDLIKKSSLKPVELQMILEQLFNSSPTPINCASITKCGKTSMFYWPTCVIAKCASFRIKPIVAPRQLPGRDMSQPTLHKENIVSKPANSVGGQTSDLSKSIYDQIAMQPGIDRSTLVAAIQKIYPEDALKRITKKIWDLVNTSKKIDQVGRANLATFYVVGTPSKHEKIVLAKVESKAGSEPKPGTPAPAQKPTINFDVPKSRSTRFELLLSDENELQIRAGDSFVILNPDQLARLDKFIARIYLGSVLLASRQKFEASQAE